MELTGKIRMKKQVKYEWSRCPLTSWLDGWLACMGAFVIPFKIF